MQIFRGFHRPFLFLFRYFSCEYEGQDLQIDQRRDPENIKHEVIAEDDEKGLLEVNRDVEAALPFEPPQPVPLVHGIHVSYFTDFPVFGTPLLKPVVGNLNVTLL